MLTGIPIICENPIGRKMPTCLCVTSYNVSCTLYGSSYCSQRAVVLGLVGLHRIRLLLDKAAA
jgi:hypothetical protein